MNVIVFGDSISFGQFISPHNTWVGQVSVKIEDLGKKLKKDIIFQCEAVNGRTTRMALETMPQEIQKHCPDIVVVQFGLNDCNYWDSDKGLTRVSKPAFKANIMEIANRSLNFGAKRVFINTNHPTTRTAPITTKPSVSYQDSNESFNTAIREAVVDLDDSRITLIDIEKTIAEEIKSSGNKVADYILPPPDALHLSSLGHSHYVNVVGDILISEIEKQIK